MTFFLPWLAVAAAITVFSTAALSLAGSSPPVAEPEDVDATEFLPVEDPLVVPDVRSQPYVFAKGILEDASFAWRLKGGAKGFPANVVVTQKPAPGTLLVDTGAPTVVLSLERNTDYEQRGLPKNSSPYEGTKNVPWQDPTGASDPPSEGLAPAAAPDSSSEEPEPRPPVFVEPGAPPEPPDEITLVVRVDKLAAKLDGAAQTEDLVSHWLFQHEWVVTGALFGWHDGEKALVKLIALDEDLEVRWGIGALSADVARDALKEVRAKTAEATPGS